MTSISVRSSSARGCGLLRGVLGVCSFAAMDHAWLVKCIEHRRGDQRVVRHRQKWLHAGVLEEGQWHAQEEGPPHEVAEPLGGASLPALCPGPVGRPRAAAIRTRRCDHRALRRRLHRGRRTPTTPNGSGEHCGNGWDSSSWSCILSKRGCRCGRCAVERRQRRGANRRLATFSA